jgi:hypothetical protein
MRCTWAVFSEERDIARLTLLERGMPARGGNKKMRVQGLRTHRLLLLWMVGLLLRQVAGLSGFDEGLYF